jgi:ribose transport system ATP-binding protein
MRSAQCGYVPGDRHADGAVGTMSIRENYFLSRYRSAKVSDSFVLRHGRERNKTLEMVDRFDVRPRQNVERPLASLSGGNQQKVIAARAIRSKPRLLVVDDPTAGVDVGARADLHRILLEAAESGTAVVLASTDYDEVALLADRALVLAAGRVVAELTGDDITAESLARHSYATSAIHSEDS